MKRIFAILIAILISTYGCMEKQEENYKSLIIGEWVNRTDESRVYNYTFNEDGTGEHKSTNLLFESEPSIEEFNYTIKDDVLMFYYTDGSTNEKRIARLDESVLKLEWYRVYPDNTIDTSIIDSITYNRVN
jgi:hypothetical protein